MRHAVSGNKLGRNSSWRKATVRDIAKATLIRQRICTTKAKAKEARKLVDRLITLGKKGTLAHRRKAFSILNDHKLVSQLFNKTAPRFQKRKGGYTRIIPLSFRRGDNAQLVYLEL
ncbi:50S ribosomal protein L17, partial [Candidatus Pacearchaeota archaeon]|nr:50S ribosomal protein L17 [Candidatus Pacearchaeota archaeon]